MAILDPNNIQKLIELPSYYSDEDKLAIGQRIVDQIKRRCSEGLDLNSRPFKYVQNSEHADHNLTETGDMLAGLDVIGTSVDGIYIGYASTNSLEANKAEGNQIGSYGGSPDDSKAKPFIGVTDSELEIILASYDRARPTTQTDEEAAADAFINNLLKEQGLI